MYKYWFLIYNSWFISTLIILNYDSCESDSKTAIFKKTWITTIASIWTYTFQASNFIATDENSNLDDETDSRFLESWETNSISITVLDVPAPIVTNNWITDSYIGWPWQTVSTVSFSSDQSWE